MWNESDSINNNSDPLVAILHRNRLHRYIRVRSPRHCVHGAMGDPIRHSTSGQLSARPGYDGPRRVRHDQPRPTGGNARAVRPRIADTVEQQGHGRAEGSPNVRGGEFPRLQRRRNGDATLVPHAQGAQGGPGREVQPVVSLAEFAAPALLQCRGHDGLLPLLSASAHEETHLGRKGEPASAIPAIDPIGALSRGAHPKRSRSVPLGLSSSLHARGRNRRRRSAHRPNGRLLQSRIAGLARNRLLLRRRRELLRLLPDRRPRRKPAAVPVFRSSQSLPPDGAVRLPRRGVSRHVLQVAPPRNQSRHDRPGIFSRSHALLSERGGGRRGLGHLPVSASQRD
mmetsp:Transcript_2917/g.6376  ORF Transcript_2917/g.6376 Transcript_2917/m.6376 type:complete len:340 (+) Transcript_2917:260-1279(+)